MLDMVNAGRPRSVEIDRRILDATLDLLIAHGYDGLRADAVAAAAGVPKSTIYRRWPSLAVLAVAAVERAVGHPEFTPTEDPRADLRTLIDILHATVLDTELGTVLPRLGTDIAAHPEAAETYRRQIIEPLRGAAIDAVRRGLTAGLWSADGERDGGAWAERAVNMIIGGALYEIAYLGRRPTGRDTRAAAAQLLRAPLGEPQA
jgi:AcrR family transcriptional regulator